MPALHEGEVSFTGETLQATRSRQLPSPVLTPRWCWWPRSARSCSSWPGGWPLAPSRGWPGPGPADVAVVDDEAAVASQIQRLIDLGATEIIAHPAGTPAQQRPTTNFSALARPA